MRRTGLMAGALALQLALSAAAVGATPQRADEVYGSGGWREMVACAACAGMGIGALVSGAATSVVITLIVGGPAAVALVGGAVTCVTVCISAVSDE